MNWARSKVKLSEEMKMGGVPMCDLSRPLRRGEVEMCAAGKQRRSEALTCQQASECLLSFTVTNLPYGMNNGSQLEVHVFLLWSGR